MRIRKIIGVLVLFNLIVSAITGCSNIDEYDETQIQSEGTKIFLSLEDAIDQSYCVVKAKLNSINEGKAEREYDFTLEETMIGIMSEASFVVYEGYTDYSVENTEIAYSTNKTQYEAGKEYILVLSKESLVYYERDRI